MKTEMQHHYHPQCHITDAISSSMYLVEEEPIEIEKA